jgi:hypothetical protein
MAMITLLLVLLVTDGKVGQNYEGICIINADRKRHS